MMQVLLQRYLRTLVVNPSMGLRAVLLLAAVLLYGTTGFLYFELPGNPDLSWTDALWYCLVTLTTVGYGDYFPKTAGGRYLVGVPLLVLGWTLATIIGFWISAGVPQAARRIASIGRAHRAERQERRVDVAVRHGLARETVAGREAERHEARRHVLRGPVVVVQQHRRAGCAAARHEQRVVGAGRQRGHAGRQRVAVERHRHRQGASGHQRVAADCR